MNTAQLKDYAPRARLDFITAVEAQAAQLGITAKGVADARVQGDVLLVGGQAFPKAVAEPREKLAARVRAEGFEPTMEAIAYTWFNRFAAMRYMELHGYLEHGFRVLSHPQGQARPEILDHAADVELPGLDRAKAVDLKLDGTKDEDLYRLLLTAQCNALHKAMPFLFERIGDETELLLPANLLHTDSLVRQLVEAIEESAWEQIEVIGWLYQFYIAEKKDEVIGKVVKSEDIPAATQLFTPNWIVKYLVQNSLGAQWVATYPNSPLKGLMEFYIEPAKQSDEVAAKLKATTPSMINPEELTLIDPASGSGHILVEAYELFKAIYLERGYRQQDVAHLILEKNLFGLDIDERASQMTGFALMMKGRSDDRHLFESVVKLNVMTIVDSACLDAVRLAQSVRLADYGLQPKDVADLKLLFEQATTFGSLVQVPDVLAKKLSVLGHLSEVASHDLFVAEDLRRLGALVRQAKLLASQYDAVVANPPYMGSGGMNAALRTFVKQCFPEAKSDLFACFMDRAFDMAKSVGRIAMVTMHSWMFLASYEEFRERILARKTICTLAHFGARAFGSIQGEVVQTAAFVMLNHVAGSYRPVFFRLVAGGEEEKRVALAHGDKRFDEMGQDAFRKLPASPLAYWISADLLTAYDGAPLLGDVADPRQGLTTSDNARFVRHWHEVAHESCGFGCQSTEDAVAAGRRWFPFNKGGAFRRWYGNLSEVVDWENDGQRIRELVCEKYPYLNGNPDFVTKNRSYYFKPGVTWSKVSAGSFAARVQPAGIIFSDAGECIFPPANPHGYCGLLNSVVARSCFEFLAPTINFKSTDVARLFLPDENVLRASGRTGERLATIAKEDWDANERSWDFRRAPTLAAKAEVSPTLEAGYTAWTTQGREAIAETKRLEEANNRLFIDAYGLTGELTPDVPIEQITLTVNPAYRYGTKLTEEEQWARFRRDAMQEVVSYAIGCMMGRYSLDAPGLIFAHSVSEGFDPSRYATFPADADGIVPLTETEWFDDDAAHRVIEFISVAWDAAHLEDNLAFLADGLSRKQNESSRETVRRYLCDSFFKDHLQTYKRRPIYWLFSSGKQKAFQCLVYLHRYNAGTLARMRSEYVIPLQGKMAARLEKLQADILVATSTAHQKRLEKERSQLAKQQVELLAFDEKLRHYADRRITLDLDDGVKVNYGKFGDLLAEVKAVTGGAEED